MRAELCCEPLRWRWVAGACSRADPPLRQGEPIGWGVSQADQKGGAHSIDAPKGAGPDNAAMESFFASLKKERVHRQRFKTLAPVKAAIFEYIEVFYNRQGRHSGIGYQTPQQAFNKMTWKMAA